MTRVYVFDANQQPQLKSLKSYTDFSFDFLLSSQDYYPKSRDNLEQLELQKFNKVKIGKKYKVEEFWNPIPQDKTTYHNGYLQYLLTAWLNDCGICVGPWHIWNVILHQLCQAVKAEPEKYRDVFTTSSEKIIITFTDGAMFDIDRFIDELKHHVPLNIDTFVPQFPNQPPLYRESMYGLFADMVQEYYGCMILGCSLPKVRVLGSDADWIALIDTVKSVNAFFAAKGIQMDYLTRATSSVFEIIVNLNNPEFWRTFFAVERCGSGSQQQIGGHILKLLLRQGTYLIHELPDMISRYPFEYLPNGNLKKDMNFVSGVFFSSLDNEGYLVPEYHTNLTYYDHDLCKVEEQDSRDIDVLIEFLKRMRKYSDDGGYTKNHITYKELPSTFQTDMTHSYRSNNLQEFPIADFETYYEKASRYEMGSKKDLLYRFKKLYEKNVKAYTKHNQRVQLSKGKLDRYLQLLEEERQAKRNQKHHFWSGPTFVVESQNDYLYSNDLPVLDYDTWVSKLPLQAEDVAFIEKHFDLIYRYVANNHSEVFTKYLLNMYNPRVLEMFLSRYRVEPFPLDLRSGYTWTDPYTNKDADAYERLRFNLCHHFESSYRRDAKIGQALISYILNLSDSRPVVEQGVYSLRQRIISKIKQAKEYPERDYYTISKQIKENDLISDINRVNYLCRLTGHSYNPVEIVNTELESAGFTERLNPP